MKESLQATWNLTGVWFTPLVTVAVAALAGIALERIVLGRLEKLASRTKLAFDDILIRAFRGIPALWITLVGLKFGMRDVALSTQMDLWFRQVILIIIIASVTLLLARIAGGLIASYGARAGEVLPSTSIFRNLTYTIVYALGLMMVLQVLGVEITPVLTALGIGGLAVALALKDTLDNLFAGLYIIASNQVKPGDYIRVETGEEGYVTDIRWRHTTVRALPNNMYLIPNARMASVIITNYHQPEPEMSVVIQVGVSYDSDLEKVERVTIEVAKDVLQTVEGGVKDFEPFTRYHTFDQSSINFSVILRVREFVDQHLVRHEFVKRLQKRYQQEGIVIPFPIRTLVFQDGKGLPGGMPGRD